MLRQALTAFNQKKYSSALELLTNVVNSPDKTLLASLIADAQGNLALAFRELHTGILSFKENDKLLLQLCKFSKKYGKHENFVNFLKTNNLQVRSNELAQSYLSLLVESEALTEALAFDNALSVNFKTESGYIWYQAELYKQLGKIENAIDILKSGMLRYPDDFHLAYRLANFYQEKGEARLAIELYETLLAKYPTSPELNYALACAKYNTQDYQQTRLYLDKTLTLAPNYIPAHESYSKLMWALNDKENLTTSYQLARKQTGLHPQVVHSEVSQLLRVDKLDQAMILSQHAIKEFAHIPEIMHMYSVVLDKVGDTEQAIQILSDLSKQNPYHTRINLDLANHYLIDNQITDVSRLLEKPLQVDPDNQELWAYKSITWRLAGDERFLWLNDYQRIIGQFEIPTPLGFGSLDDFLHELKASLNQLHAREKNQPLDQSVRFGTQTDGHLLLRHNELLRKFKTSFDLCLNSYLSNLPIDNTHPLYRRNTGKYKANGSWSVKLEQGGFHTNHIHPRGWISGPTYVSVPEDMSPSDPSRSGWLKLGETCLGLGDRENVDLAICPTPGMLVFFPSFVWHGTYPLLNAGERMTIPCDISPIK